MVLAATRKHLCTFPGVNRREGATQVGTRWQCAVIDSRRRGLMGGFCQQPIMAVRAGTGRKLKPNYRVHHMNFRKDKQSVLVWLWHWHSGPHMINKRCTVTDTHKHTHTLIKYSFKWVWSTEQEWKMNYGSYSNGWLTPLISRMLMWLGKQMSISFIRKVERSGGDGAPDPPVLTLERWGGCRTGWPRCTHNISGIWMPSKTREL